MNQIELEDTRLETKCFICGKSSKYRLMFHQKLSKENIAVFSYMEIEQEAHMECYIDLCVKMSMEKYKILEEKD